MTSSSPSQGDQAVELVPVNVVLTQLTAELQEMVSLSDHIQTVIGGLIKENSAELSDNLYQLQSLDRLRQTIAGIADFIETLATNAPPQWSMDASRAAQSVRLTDLRSRLSCEPGASTAAHPTDAGGCALF